MDFNKSVFAPLGDDNCKKMIAAVSFFLKHAGIVDEWSAVNHKDPLDMRYIGADGQKIPDNMTSMGNYLENLNINQFRAKKHEEDDDHGDALSKFNKSKGKAKEDIKGHIAYFAFYFSGDKTPQGTINQVALEWSNYGTFIRVKELQAVDTFTPLAIYFVYIHNQRQTIQTELMISLKKIQQTLHDKDYFIDNALPFDWGTKALPALSLRANVPQTPKTKNQALVKLPRHLQTNRRVWHIEVARDDAPLLKLLAAEGKKMGIFKEVLGTHAHVTETVNWESPPGDLKRAASFAKDMTNYNASMSCGDVHGLMDLDDKVRVTNSSQYLSGRFCLLHLLKLKDGGSAVAEVHQAAPGDVVNIVHPNIPEAEAIVTNLGKHPAGFLWHFLTDCGVDKTFVSKLLQEFVDPALVHEIEACKWDAKHCTILTPQEVEDEAHGEQLVSQSWFRDIVRQHECNTNGPKKSKNYANAANLYNIDEEKSVKTMHERHDGIDNAAEYDDDPVANVTAGMESAGLVDYNDGTVDAGQNVEMTTGWSQEDLDEETAPSSKRSGHTPTSVGVRFSEVFSDEASDDEDINAAGGSIPRGTATASDAAYHDNSEAGRSG